MTDNHMVFFAEIAFIYGGNDSSEKDVFGSERSSEKLWFDVGIKIYTTDTKKSRRNLQNNLKG